MIKRAMWLAGVSVLAYATVSQAQYTHSSKTTIDYVQDVNSSSNTGSLIVGDSSGKQVAIDDNEIQARAAGGGTSTLHLQAEGGDLRIGSNSSKLTLDGLSLRTNDTAYGLWIDGGRVLFMHRPNPGEMHATFDVDELINWGRLVLHDGLSMFSPSTFPGSATACFSSSGTVRSLGLCSSSRHLKTHIRPLVSGLELVLRMQPVSFTWKQTGQSDLGFVAEEASAIVPELVVQDEHGKPHSFNYRHYTAVLTRAIQEQQAAIEQLQQQLAQSQQAVSTLQQQVQEQRAQLQQLSTARE